MNNKIFLTVLAVFFIGMPVFGQWEVSESIDEMTGDTTAYAHSQITSPTKRMDVPYSDTRAWIGIGCDGEDEWAYIGFSNSPNLNDDETEDGYNRINTRVKWNEEIVETQFTQEWGSKFLHFRWDASYIEKIAKSNTMTLELNWYGIGKVYFKFSLEGSAVAIKKMRDKCK